VSNKKPINWGNAIGVLIAWLFIGGLVYAWFTSNAPREASLVVKETLIPQGALFGEEGTVCFWVHYQIDGKLEERPTWVIIRDRGEWFTIRRLVLEKSDKRYTSLVPDEDFWKTLKASSEKYAGFSKNLESDAVLTRTDAMMILIAERPAFTEEQKAFSFVDKRIKELTISD
jgi:hypothetical protein